MLALLAATACATPNDPLSPHSLLQEIKTHGARSVVARLHEDMKVPGKTGGLPEVVHNGGWYHVLEQIKTGDAQWLDVARALKPGTDGHASEDLQVMVAFALPTAAEQALRMLSTDPQGFQFKWVCSSPHNEPLPGVAEEYLQRAEMALLALRVPELEERRQLCLQYIREEKQRLLELSAAPSLPTPWCATQCDDLSFDLIMALFSDKQEPRAVLQGLRQAPGSQWALLLEMVARGDPRVFPMVQKLGPGIDRAADAELTPALARALAHAPDLVLKVIDNNLTLREICGAPFAGTAAALSSYFSAAEQALRAMAAETLKPAEKEQQQACLSRLEEAKKMRAGGSR